VHSIHLDAIDRQSKSPIYRQIAEQIRLQISEGRMPIGTRLPTVRELAAMLSVTRLTAQNAYRELQAGGWIESTVGRGSHVAASASTQAILTMVGRRTTPEHIMNDMPRLSRLTGLRSLAYAESDPDLFPMADLLRFFEHPMAQDSSLMLYGLPQGDEMLRIELVKLLAERGLEATPDDIMVTSGVSQALSLLSGCLARPGDVVVVEQPVYLGMLHVLNALGIKAVGVPLDEEGLRLDALEQVIREHQPRFIYTIPHFQNPTGACMSVPRCKDLLALAGRYDVPIVEDDIYGLLAYDEAAPLPLKAYDTSEHVIYLSSMSKTLMPGLRIGYMLAPSKLRERVLLYRQAHDISGPHLLQRALANFLHRGRFKIHLERVIPEYRARRDELMLALAHKMPSTAQWTRPTGGFCCWLTLPRLPADFYQQALRRGMAFTPGEAFLIEPEEQSHIRLCFGGLPPQLIREAITILAALLEQSSAPLSERMRGLSHELPLV